MGKITSKGLAENMIKIQHAFPTLPTEFYDILLERMKAKGFTDERLTNAVNFVVDTCKYPTPTIAHFIAFDEENHIEESTTPFDQPWKIK